MGGTDWSRQAAREASATCLILRIDPDGQVTLANAGQLPPYLNGKEIAMEGALPIGIVSEAEFSIAAFGLEHGDSLILMSDGVVEAQDSQGALFGFERQHERLDFQPESANLSHEIACLWRADIIGGDNGSRGVRK